MIVNIFSWCGRPKSLWTIGDMLGRPYFMFVMHISPFSFLKTVLDLTSLGRLLWMQTTCRSPSIIILWISYICCENTLKNYLIFLDVFFNQDCLIFKNTRFKLASLKVQGFLSQKKKSTRSYLSWTHDNNTIWFYFFLFFFFWPCT